MVGIVNLCNDKNDRRFHRSLLLRYTTSTTILDTHIHIYEISLGEHGVEARRLLFCPAFSLLARKVTGSVSYPIHYG